MENLFATIRRRQGERIQAERRAGKNPNDLFLAKEDLIGPDPSQVVVESKSWKTLQSMIGLGSVKQSVQDLFDMAKTNYQRELQELEPQQISLNRVFVGSPGTGKTALVNAVLASLEAKLQAEDVRVLSVNCMALDGVDAVWQRLAEILGNCSKSGGRSRKSKDTPKQAVEKALASSKKKW